MADLENTADKVAGAAKDAAGAVTGDNELQAEGKVQKTVAEAKDTASEAADAAAKSAETAKEKLSDAAETVKAKADEAIGSAGEAISNGRAQAGEAKVAVEDKVAELRRAAFESLPEFDDVDNKKVGVAAAAAVVAGLVLFFFIRFARNR